MATPLLSLVIYRHDDNALGVHSVGHAALKRDHRLDARVSLLATGELAKRSPAFAADLEATNHFVQHLEKVTRGITDQLVIPDDLAALDVPPPVLVYAAQTNRFAQYLYEECGRLHIPISILGTEKEKLVQAIENAAARLGAQ